MGTFAELGIPFPLFEASGEDAAEYVGEGDCTLCGAPGAHCFDLGIGCAVLLPCASCGTLNALDAADREAGPCRACAVTVAFPYGEEEAELLTCYACLRAGRAALTKDTELGMVSWEQAFAGVTHGIPGMNRSDYEMVPKDGSDWVGARLQQTWMWELLRTPTYVTIQGETWQFCCHRPMVFVGTWDRPDFARHAPDGNGRGFFEQIVQDIVPGLWEDRLHDETGIYVFRCPECRRMTAHWDIA